MSCVFTCTKPEIYAVGMRMDCQVGSHAKSCCLIVCLCSMVFSVSYA